MPTIHNVNFILAFCNVLIVGTNLSPFISYAQPMVIQFFAINLSTSRMNNKLYERYPKL